MRLKQIAFLLFLLLMGVGFVQIGGQTYRLFKKSEEKKSLQAEQQQWQEKNKLLSSKIRALDSNNIDKDLLEELVRKKLGYDYPNERRLKQ